MLTFQHQRYLSKLGLKRELHEIVRQSRGYFGSAICPRQKFSYFMPEYRQIKTEEAIVLILYN